MEQKKTPLIEAAVEFLSRGTSTNLLNEADEMIHGMTSGGHKIHLNRTKTDNDSGEKTHYTLEHPNGTKKHFSVNPHARENSNEVTHAHVAKKSGLPANHPIVKTIADSHNGTGGPEAWQE